MGSRGAVMADLGLWLKGLAGVTAGLAVFYNLPTSLWLPAESATLQYLAAGTLQRLDESGEFLQVITSVQEDMA